MCENTFLYVFACLYVLCTVQVGMVYKDNHIFCNDDDDDDDDE